MASNDSVESTIEDAQRFHRVGDLTPKVHACEEVTGMIGDQYTRCGRVAYVLVKHIGHDEGPYWMCEPCADHNIRHRHAKDVTPKVR